MFHRTLDPIRHPVASLRGLTVHGLTVLRTVLVLAIAGLLLPLAPRAAGARTGFVANWVLEVVKG